jgi:uncharacterized protein (TIGR02147 family)
MEFRQDYRDIIKDELDKRIAKNSHYNLSSLAKDLDITRSKISEVLAHKQGLSLTKAQDFSNKFKFNKVEKEYFCLLVESEHARSKTKKDQAVEKLKSFHKIVEKNLDSEAFKVLSGWEHFTIMEMSKTKHFKSDSLWIAQVLNISVLRAQRAIKRLIHFNILKVVKNRITTTGKFLVTSTHDVPKTAIRAHHKEHLEKAIIAIDNQPIDERDFQTVIIGIDKEKVPELKELIYEFNRNLNKIATSSPDEKKDSVYCYSTQLYSLFR